MLVAGQLSFASLAYVAIQWTAAFYELNRIVVDSLVTWSLARARAVATSLEVTHITRSPLFARHSGLASHVRSVHHARTSTNAAD